MPYPNSQQRSAVRFVGAGASALTRESAIPAVGAFTACGWTQRTSNAFYGTLIALENAGGGYLSLQHNDVTDTLTCFQIGAADITCGSKPIDRPYFWALVSAGAAAGETRVYIRDTHAKTFEVYPSTGALSPFTPNGLRIGANTFSEYYDGAIWGVMVWDRALTEQELLAQSFRPQAPIDATKLNLWYPLDTDYNIRDFGPNQRDPIRTGTLRTDGVRALPVTRKRRLLATIAGGAGTLFTVTCSAAAAGGVSLTRTVRKTLTAASSGTSSLSKKISKTLSATASGATAVSKKISKALATTSVGVATLTTAAVIGRAFSVAAAGVASLASRAVLGVTSSVTAVGAASVSKKIGKTFSAAASGTASVSKRIGKGVSVVATGASSVTRKVSRTFALTATGTAAHADAIVLSVSRAFGATATVSSARLFIAGTGEVINTLVRSMVRTVVRAIVRQPLR